MDNVRFTNFYDNDSGGEGDARVEFVTPQSGIYLLHVGDFTDVTAGCYRYHVVASADAQAGGWARRRARAR